MKCSTIKSHKEMKRLLVASDVKFDEEDDGSLCITSYDFQISARFCDESRTVYLSSFWPAIDASSELDLLRFVNRCNQGLSFGQFCLSPDSENFVGFYHIRSKHGIDPQMLLHSINLFAHSFSKAINEVDDDGLLGVDPEIEYACAQRSDPLLH